MSSIVELARMPEIQVVSISGNTDEQPVELPGGVMKFVIFSPTADTTVYWAVESGQVTNSSGRRRTIPSGEKGSSERMYVPNGATLYLGASGAATVEVEIYKKY